MTKVSIIIPVYNVEQYLKPCLESVINQTLKDIQIICVNDGSTDNSLNILKEYANKDCRIKIINQTNCGQAAARNTAILAAEGEYIGFVDSDDLIEADFYEKLYNTATKFDAEIACTNILRASENKSKYFIKYKKLSVGNSTREKYKLAKLPEHNYIMNKIYHREKLLRCQVEFQNGVLYEDILWTHKIIHYLGKLVTVPDTTYHYRDNRFSTVNTKSDRNIAALDKAYREALEFVNRNNIRIRKLRRYPWDKRTEYKVLNIPIITVKKYYGIIQYYLFGKLPVFEAKINKRFYKKDEKEEIKCLK